MASAHTRSQVAASVFVLAGLAFIAGAGVLLNSTVIRPATWPVASALVTESNVVNPRGPDEFEPELVFRIETGGSPRDVEAPVSMRMSSYASVRHHVDRFPVGARLNVAVNPNDPDDIRYDLAWSFDNLLGPVVLAATGLLFAGIGVPLLVSGWRRARAPGTLASRPLSSIVRMLRIASWAVVGIGVIFVAIGVTMYVSNARVKATWAEGDAQVLDSQLVRKAGSGSRRSARPSITYDVAVTFRYVVNGVTYERTTESGLSTDSATARVRLENYPPGATRRIWHRPGDPNVIRFDLNSAFAGYLPAVVFVVLGLVPLVLGTIFLVAIPRFVGAMKSWRRV